MCERKIFGKNIWFAEERKNGTEKEENDLGKESVTMCDRQTHRQNCEDRARILDSEFTIHLWLPSTDACLVIEGHMKMVGRQVFFTERFFETRHLLKSATSRSGFQTSHVSPVFRLLISLLFSLLSLSLSLF